MSETESFDELKSQWLDLLRSTHAREIVLTNVHSSEVCAGKPCIIHNPSMHHMRDWPLIWRNDRGIFERKCPHGVGHPDPDQGGPNFSGVHGCDGCCSSDIIKGEVIQKEIEAK